jgi:hypothetical protein
MVMTCSDPRSSQHFFGGDLLGLEGNPSLRLLRLIRHFVHFVLVQISRAVLLLLFSRDV